MVGECGREWDCGWWWERAWAWDLEMDGWMVLIPRDVAREGCNLLLNGNQDDPSFHLLVEERFVE